MTIEFAIYRIPFGGRRAAPTIVLTTAVVGVQKDPFVVTATASEVVTGLTLGDISVTNGAASGFATADNIVFTFTVTAAADGAVVIQIPAGVCFDATSIPNTASNTLTVQADITAPGFTLSHDIVSEPTNQAIHVTAVATEEVTGLVAGDITVSGAVLSDFATADNITFTWTLTASTDGIVTTRIPAGVCADLAGNANTISNELSIAVLVEAPTVVITSDAVEPVSAAFTSTFTFSKAVTGFVVGDITVTNGALSGFATADNITFTATCTPDWAGPVTLAIAAGVCTDAAGNANLAASDLAVTIPANTVAPAINATSTIGTTNTATPGTWTGSPTLTYQWQRYLGGAWGNIAGATIANRAPIDADFGYALRLAETATKDSFSATAYSNQTALTAEAPAQSLGSELLIDGDMEAVGTAAYTAINNATLSKQAGAQGGSQCLRIAYNGTAGPFASQAILTENAYFDIMGYLQGDGANTARATHGGTTIVQTAATSWVGLRAIFRATNTSFRLGHSGVTGYAEADTWAVKALTLNTQLVAPSANMRTDCFYTLPGSPLIGTQAWLLSRVSDFAAGNYWNGVLIYTGTQWDITLYSVASFVRTSRITASNVGATVGIRVNMNADSISLFTTANGTDWTQRGTPISNSAYQTATGVNALWTSDVTPGNLVYAAAD